jgi:CheY-like chemotaxis protein
MSPADAASGIRIAQREPFDVIVMAALMPGMDGTEATRRLKADERTRAIPILIMIDDPQESRGRAAVEAGAAGTCLASSPPERVEDEIHNIAGSGIP